MWAGSLQALVVLDYVLLINRMTAADVSLGRGREAVSSTTRNQSSSELQMGRNRNRAPPSPNRDEVPCLGSEGPHQLGEELPITITALFIIRNIKKPTHSLSLLELGGSVPTSDRRKESCFSLLILSHGAARLNLRSGPPAATHT